MRLTLNDLASRRAASSRACAGESFTPWYHSGVEAGVIVILAALNYRGVLMTLNVNFVITALAYLAIIILFFFVQRTFIQGITLTGIKG